ncbi:Putative inheritance of peroxisomes protein [Colletotrichum destructivum]|uniref:Inheritance of peroxisomes protein 1 n=1 Tax=Colletotrichum destructivum TaxID=34406 RepID=A0AAX4INX8_9PEZI|nr:Putative inheritance of peroxisomes protein [Colletotrichum destructivum]
MESLRPTYPLPRRVATAPVPTQMSRPSSSAGGLIETLYNHPNVKIVAFTAVSRGRPRSPGRGLTDEPGHLSAYSQLERTIAIGPFRIYRTGSVAFLNCGSALQPMLPKSQCWALAEDSSKFVLQIRRPNYWRIEIPVTNPDEQELAVALKGVWDQILQFEKTECPFKRSFTIALPDKPKTPVKKRPWTPPVKGALPVLSTPAHEVEASPTPRALTPNTGRRASTTSLRGRRLSVISNDVRSSSRSREPSTEIPAFAESKEDEQYSTTEATETTAPATESHMKTEEAVEDIPRLVVETASQMVAGKKKQAIDVADREASAVYEVHNLTAAEDSIAEEADFEDDEPNAELSSLVVAQSTKPRPAGEVQCDARDLDSAKAATVTAALVSKPETGSPSTSASALPTEMFGRLKDNETLQMPSGALAVSTLASAPRDARTDVCTDTAVCCEQLAEPGSPLNEIKEQLITVEVPPKTPLLAGTSTPTPTNIYDVIRNYEYKMAAAALEPAPAVDEPAIVPEAEADNAHENASGIESHSGSEEEAVLEGSGVVGGRRKKLRGFRAGRALVPPQLTVVTSPPSKSAMRSTPILDDAASPTGSADSFHSSRSWHSPVTPVPRSPASDASPTRFPYPHDNILIPKKPWHYRDISDLTVTPETRRTWDATSSLTDDSSQESAATAPDIASEVVEQPDKVALSEDEATTSAVARRPYIRHRSTTSGISVGHRALSPLPTAANLFAPSNTQARHHPLRSRLELVRRIPMAIVSKTCEVLLGPPSHLIALMLQVAAKIAAGQWRGMMFGFGEGGETIPVQWDYSDDEYDSWGENDDFYLSQVESSRASSVIGGDDADSDAATDNANGTGRGWEVD